jgi:hypothetical protein
MNIHKLTPVIVVNIYTLRGSMVNSIPHGGGHPPMKYVKVPISLIYLSKTKEVIKENARAAKTMYPEKTGFHRARRGAAKALINNETAA